MTWLERIETISVGAGSFIAASVIGGLIWMVRTFFTDRARIDALEQEMKRSQEEIKAHRTEIKEGMTAWREEVRHDFDQVNKTLASIQEWLRK